MVAVTWARSAARERVARTSAAARESRELRRQVLAVLGEEARPSDLLWCFDDGSRKLLTRAGFFSPSLDGGLLLLVLSNPSRRSSSAMRAFSATISVACAATSAISSSLDGSGRESNSGFIESLNRNSIQPSRKI